MKYTVCEQKEENPAQVYEVPLELANIFRMLFAVKATIPLEDGANRGEIERSITALTKLLAKDMGIPYDTVKGVISGQDRQLSSIPFTAREPGKKYISKYFSEELP